MAQIVVVDDDKRLTDMLRRLLARAGWSVVAANSGLQGLVALAEPEAALVILDVAMPGMDGFEVLRRLRAAGHDLPVLMLTARDAVEDRVTGLETGADDYLIKPFAPEELIARVRALLRRRPAPTDVLSYADLHLDTAGRLAYRQERIVALSTTEYTLLEAFLHHPEQVLLREQLMEQVWGYDFAGDTNVLEVYVGYLRRKLEAAGEPRLIQTVRGAGYVLRAAPAPPADVR
ncbi:MAG: response regulator transcription factor [Candidatus Dormibacteraeota bacterium]|nr:response regulator transcription factor [Candidatus Dormibacteraeota bacterium]